MKTERFGTILFLMVVFSIASSLTVYAGSATTLPSGTTQAQPAQSTLPPNVAMAAPPSDAAALAGAVPIIFFADNIPQGAVDETRGDKVKDTMWVAGGGYLMQYRTVRAILGFRGVITRMTAHSFTGASSMVATYTLYVNGQPTRLTCQARYRTCSANWNVPIKINDEINIAVHLPKTEDCIKTGNGCAGATPIITLMVRMTP